MKAKDTKKVVAILVGVLMISASVFAGQPANMPSAVTPSTDAAIWGGGGNYGPPAKAAGTSRDNGQTTRVVGHPDNRVSPERSFGQSVKDFLKFIEPLAEAAIWG